MPMVSASAIARLWLRLFLAALFLAGGSTLPAAPARGDDVPGSIIDAFEREMLQLARRSEPFVVNVEAHLARPNESSESATPLGLLNARNLPKKRIGSGIALDDHGTIITTASIVDGATAILIQNFEGQTFRARLVGLDRRTNVALLSAPDTRTLPARLGESSLVTPGSRVVVVGSLPARKPLSSFGCIEVDRGLIWGYSEVEMLQLNAPVYRGHIGAPVVNSEGRVVGMVCGTLEPRAGQARGTTTAGLSGYIYEDRIIPRPGTDVSFAIPIEKAQEIVAELADHGRVDRGFLGVMVRRGEARGNGLKGVLIDEVLRGGPADKAGLQVGDAILEYAGQPVSVGDDVTFLVMATRPGSRVPLRVTRGKSEQLLEVTIGLAPNQYPSSPRLVPNESTGGGDSSRSPAPGSRRP